MGLGLIEAGDDKRTPRSCRQDAGSTLVGGLDEVFRVPRLEAYTMKFLATPLPLAAVVLTSTFLAGAAEPFNATGPFPMLSPAEVIKSMQMPEGYRMELVVGEPHIKEPVVAAFDGNGRMFVAEMRTYMQDIDATGEDDPKSQISLHWSSKGDGNFDKHSVFINKLLLPRMILPLGKGELLVNETHTQDIYLYRDTDGDGVSDEKKLWYAGGPRGGNMEHQQSGLIWGLDNWMYMAVNNWRLRWQGYDQPPLKESTYGNGGQWGLTQDDNGKAWIVNAGGERGPLNFQTHFVYGNFNTKSQFVDDFAIVWPLVGLADVQGGTSRFRPEDGTLNHFSATCGQEVFRGDRLPADIRGDLIFSEPVGRLIRRTKIEVKEGLTYLSNPYPKAEFIRSKDPNFRVVNANTAPDGTLYLVDMYRGIIQEGNWTKPGSYLRGAILKHGLEKNIGHGRIWRVAHKDFKPGPQPRMYEETPAQLVAHLTHPNGWWRDTAQKLIILKNDKSVVPALMKLAKENANPLTRIHALWTLEGLNALTPEFVREKLRDANPQVRSAAIRASETLYKAGEKALEKEVAGMLKDADANVAIQALATAKLLNFPEAKAMIQASALGTNSAAGLREIAMHMLAPARSWGREYSAADKKLLERGDEIFKELCFACHNPDGKGTPIEGKPGLTLAPPLAGSRTVTGHKDGLIHVLLKGMAGPINGKVYDSQMVPMESNDDEWIAAIASYVRNSFGNRSSTVTPQEVAKVRAESKVRTEPWTIEELMAVLPQAPLGGRNKWKLTASHNVKNLDKALDGNPTSRWDTSAFQVPGMWLQVELPKETDIAGLVLDTAGSAGDYPRGYEVRVSLDGKEWGKPVVTGKGTTAMTEIQFAPMKAKFIRIDQTGEVKGLFWSIHELDILEPPSKKTIKATVKKAGESFE
jgi:mono/diheme cytochrome c family protein